MFDFSFGELAVIGAVALVVLGPERLPRVARNIGEWVGKAQRYVSQVKSDINREIELAELKKLQQEAKAAAEKLQSTVDNAMSELQSGLNASALDVSDPWGGVGEPWQSKVFTRRYKAGPSVDELAEEVARLKRQLALPDAYAGTRRKYSPRARVNRTRIRR
jgi:sec-independent protein translocase protein TatB